jgi:predicted small lipoprotein YifL
MNINCYENMSTTTQNRWCRLLVTTILVFSMSGCGTSRPPYIPDRKVLPLEQFSSQNPPEVRVRFAGPEEAKNITEFPGKKDLELSAQIDSAGSLLLAPVLFVFFWPEFLNPDNWHFRQDPKIKEALAQFPSRLAKAIEQRFVVSPTGGSRGLLEVVYFADVLTIGPAADRVCFVVHAQITHQSKGEVLYQEIIRIDPRAFSDDIQQPDCTQSPCRILDYADEVIPRMIQTRLPGLPWKPNP